MNTDELRLVSLGLQKVYLEKLDALDPVPAIVCSMAADLMRGAASEIDRLRAEANRHTDLNAKCEGGQP